MIQRIRDWLIDPDVESHDVDSAAFSLAHRRLVMRKAILRQLFEKFYHDVRAADLAYFTNCPGKRLEIGSGAGILSEVYPDVITSDLKVLPFIDIVMSADALPFLDNSLRAVYAINVFHHLPNPRKFFREILRTVHPGGGVVLIEPFYGPFASWMFKRLHKSEGFEPEAASWESETGAFSNANQALSYVVFKRDRAQFLSEFPEFEIVSQQPHTHFWYLVSGGVNFRQLVPDGLTSAVKATERLLSPLDRWIALQQTIVLRKK
jgi:SAM-dependent methyltransferase